MNKKVAIIGSVGIPAKYGGFETLVEYLSIHLSSKLDLTVYCSRKAYSERLKTYNNTHLRYIPLHANGAQSIPYDILSILHALFYAETLLILGVSGCCILPLVRLFTKKKIVINIDGLEWKRNKWGKFTKNFLKFSEKLAVRCADVIVADNVEIQRHVKNSYGKESVLIPYGGDHTARESLSKETLENYPFLKEDYALKVCRIEPENNIEMILEAFSLNTSLPLVIVGNWENSDFGKEMRKKYEQHNHIHLLNPIYNQHTLNEIRCGSKIYIHGHSAGGTNPSLVEAMSLGLPIFAYAVNYNKETTSNQALFFEDSSELVSLIEKRNDIDLALYGQKMQEIADQDYVWSIIAEKYLEHLR
jgi:glycosyltransferase involved in cell wall biosynthesis